MANTFYADSSETRVALITESDWGTTPSSPAFKTMRVTSESLTLETETAQSNEIRDDRNVADLIRMSEATGGSIEMELSHDDVTNLLMESALQSEFSATAPKNMANGVAQKSFTIERLFKSTSSGSATNTFIRHTGMLVDTMSVSMSAGSMITTSYGFVGKQATADNAGIASASYPPQTTSTLMSASQDFASLTMSGLTPVVSSLTLNTTNNLRRQQAVGTDTSVGIGNGRFECTGTIDFYLEDKTVLDEYLTGDNTSSLSFIVGSTTNKKYKFNIPTIKFESVAVNAGGNDQDVFVSVGFRGLFNTSINGTLEITKEVA